MTLVGRTLGAGRIGKSQVCLASGHFSTMVRNRKRRMIPFSFDSTTIFSTTDCIDICIISTTGFLYITLIPALFV